MNRFLLLSTLWFMLIVCNHSRGCQYPSFVDSWEVYNSACMRVCVCVYHLLDSLIRSNSPGSGVPTQTLTHSEISQRKRAFSGLIYSCGVAAEWTSINSLSQTLLRGRLAQWHSHAGHCAGLTTVLLLPPPSRSAYPMTLCVITSLTVNSAGIWTLERGRKNAIPLF